MTKLISRNLIQRFKEGKKIQKFQNAGIISYKGRDGIDYEAFSGPKGWYYRKKGTQDILNMPKNYVTTTGIRFYDDSGNMIKNPSNNQNAGKNLDYRRALENSYYSQQGKGRSYTENGNNYWMGSDGSKTFVSGKVIGKDGKEYWKGSDGSMTLLKKETNSVINQKKIPINWNQQYNDFSNNLTTSQKAWLTNEGVDYNNVESIQNYLLGKLGKNALGKWGIDKRWGSASQAAWDKFASQTDFTPKVSISPEQIEKDRQTIINQVLPQPKLPTIPEGGISNFTPLSTTKTYNRADVRDYIRSKGFRAYDFTGDQRKALRMVLNGQGTDADKALVQSMGIFKKGGQLPSRNPITRFKNRNFN